jgi:predicted nucleotidyltransferase/biotin operon repressor
MVILLAIWSLLCDNITMRFHKPLNDVLGSRIKVDILRLLSRTGSDHTGREIASIIGCSHNAARSALEDLELSGLVIHRQAGRANLYSLDENNVINTDILASAFLAEDRLLEDVAEIIFEGMGDDLSSIILYGSVARGEEGKESDIDIVVVLEDSADPDSKEEAIADASIEVVRRFGNKLSPIVVTESEFARKQKSGKGVWRDVAIEGIELKSRRGET